MTAEKEEKDWGGGGGGGTDLSVAAWRATFVHCTMTKKTSLPSEVYLGGK